VSYVIESGISFEEAVKRGRPVSPEREAMLGLEVGQSFLVPDADRAQLARCLMSRLDGRKFTSRKLREGWRFWRTE
jgi:hypothetical protein